MLISAVLLVLFREDFGRLYSTDPEVLKIVADNVILLGIIVVFDGIQVGLFRVRQPFMSISLTVCVFVGHQQRHSAWRGFTHRCSSYQSNVLLAIWPTSGTCLSLYSLYCLKLAPNDIGHNSYMETAKRRRSVYRSGGRSSSSNSMDELPNLGQRMGRASCRSNGKDQYPR